MDWRRFERPQAVNRVPRPRRAAYSSADREPKGSIPKAGNSHCRHALVQAAWTYHYRPHHSVEIRRRAAGPAPEGRAIA
jgi:transposase